MDTQNFTGSLLVRPDAHVVLLDFGLVAELTPVSKQELPVRDLPEPIVVGTPSHMAPEQAMGQALLEASDWYAVGIMHQ